MTQLTKEDCELFVHKAVETLGVQKAQQVLNAIDWRTYLDSDIWIYAWSKTYLDAEHLRAIRNLKNGRRFVNGHGCVNRSYRELFREAKRVVLEHYSEEAA